MIRYMLVATMAAVAFVAVLNEVGAVSSETYRQLNMFGDVFERVRSEYVEEVDDAELIEAAIQGMLSSLDPHSTFLNSKAYGEMQVHTRGEFGGLGIEVTMENGLVKVISPIDDTPAYRAGMQPGDLIVGIDGEPVFGLTLGEAVELMRGPVNSEIVITVQRSGVEQPFDVAITRDVIRIRSVKSRAEGKVAFIRVTSFNEQTESGVEKAMRELRKEIGDGLQGVVIDLRNNPGGLLDQAVAVSDAFLEKGEIVSTRGRGSRGGQRFNARAGDIAEGLPVVVLINGGSASAAEIVAGALQDHRRAIILGTRSFGKGSVQTVIPLPGEGAMRLTTARYYTPSGRSIQAKGIEPDILVDAGTIQVTSDAARRREEDLRGRLDSEVQNSDSPEVEEEIAAELTEDDALRDYQLQRALDLIRGLALFENRV
ncbi:MAG: putative CtpA-like serine protease [Alphaproteobacteria bacterium MarineAlpha9_Bin5]|nr:MAG: putative CtpA-like serine protease [Alphaproteobacteria bacterium MarineAlpha9_Bin5]PPR35221.1 MAG: putative CtpA-like serine protease [Alphaproteobacteria bacterium MarineAlpha9_Bin6]HIM71836.1 S41 family peptidase [Alphaproteobacteria bacterium]